MKLKCEFHTFEDPCGEPARWLLVVMQTPETEHAVEAVCDAAVDDALDSVRAGMWFGIKVFGMTSARR